MLQVQTLMFTATWPQEVRLLAAEFLHMPVRVTIGGDPDALNAAGTVEQVVMVLGDDDDDDDDGRGGMMKGKTAEEMKEIFAGGSNRHGQGYDRHPERLERFLCMTRHVTQL